MACGGRRRDEDEPRYALGGGEGHLLRNEAPHRMADQRCPCQPHGGHECYHVGGEVGHGIPTSRPIRVTMTALIQGIGVVGGGEGGQHGTERDL
jgi:hypothetical protein